MLVVHSLSYYCNMYSLNAVLLIRLTGLLRTQGTAVVPKYSFTLKEFIPKYVKRESACPEHFSALHVAS